MRLLLGSGGFRTAQRIQFLAAAMKAFFGDVKRLLFVPYALHDHDRYVATMCKKGINAGFDLQGIHRHDNPVKAVEQAEAIFIGGGNSFRLLNDLYRYDLLDVIRDRVRQGMPYMGVSAGSNVACPTIMTTNDMPIVLPPSYTALGLTPFQINPHYFAGHTFVKNGDDYKEHFGETRDERIKEYHEMNETPVIGLFEAGILLVDDGKIRLTGAPARLFRKEQEPMDIQPDSRIDLAI